MGDWGWPEVEESTMSNEAGESQVMNNLAFHVKVTDFESLILWSCYTKSWGGDRFEQFSLLLVKVLLVNSPFIQDEYSNSC